MLYNVIRDGEYEGEGKKGRGYSNISLFMKYYIYCK